MLSMRDTYNLSATVYMASLINMHFWQTTGEPIKIMIFQFSVIYNKGSDNKTLLINEQEGLN